MYNVPSFTLARAIGGVIAWWWGRRKRQQQRRQRWWWWRWPLSSWRNGVVDDSRARLLTVPLDEDDDTAGLPSAVKDDDEHEHEHEHAAAGSRRGISSGENDPDGGSTVVILASGLILGEGVVSIINLALASAGVPHL
ncbi:hypothetical protein EMPG_16432 [Blastomyces silverae]|uniref:Uncharacterized protein n=1 Tax=Blastomyces silverae TaxID=2060906 RepID=A0A0H1B9Q4_9EURO|nr:hypothetical protein EMPG_16432 [Blastomyces silverae]